MSATITPALSHAVTLSTDPAPSTLAFSRGRIARSAGTVRHAPSGLGAMTSWWYQGYDMENKLILSAGPCVERELSRYPTMLAKKPFAVDKNGLRYIAEPWKPLRNPSHG